MTGGKMTGNRQSLRCYKNDRNYDRGFVWVSTENLSWKEHYYHYFFSTSSICCEYIGRGTHAVYGK